jgi:hypothetical protein
MTKEWQEATEEYMKVCWARAIRAPLLFPRAPALIPTPTGTRNRAHYVQARHDGPEQVGETSPRPGEAQRRVNVRRHDRVIQTLPTLIPLFLGSNFPLVLFVCYISNQEGCELGGEEPPLGWHCVISPPVYRILEAFPVLLMRACVRRALQSPFARQKCCVPITVLFSPIYGLYPL